MDMRTTHRVLLADDCSWLFRGFWWAAHCSRVRQGGGLDWPPCFLVWPWRGTWLGAFLLCTCLWWPTSSRGRCFTVSVSSGEQSHFSRQQMPWLWGILAPPVSWRFHVSGGPPSVSAAAKKVACAGSRASCVAAMWQMAWILSIPFGEFSWRSGVASGPSLCRAAEGLPRCSDGCLLSSVSLTEFLFFPQPWAGWPSVWSGKPWRHPRDMG